MDEYVRTRELVEESADLTNVPVDVIWHRLKTGKKCPHSIVGTAVLTKAGDKWGVLILDSSNEYTCVGHDDEKKDYKILNTAFNELQRTLVACHVVRANDV